MTSEIIIMNKEAIALAADSAVTLPTEKKSKIFTSGNKIFTLSKYCPVGIMVYGNALFMGMPWETIIKVYRDELGKKEFNTTKEYASSLIGFLTREDRLPPDSEQEQYVKERTHNYLYYIKEEIIRSLEEIIHERKIIKKEEIEAKTSEVISNHYNMWKKAEYLPSIPEDHVRNLMDRYGTIFTKAAEDVFEELPISKRLYSKLKEIGANLFAKAPKISAGISGVVVAGFGEQDVFPSFQSFFVDGIANNVLKYWEHTYQEITFDMGASIIPFAQSEMIATFIEGIAPDYESEIELYLRELINNYPDVIIESIEKLNDDEKKVLKLKLEKLSGEILEQCIKELSIYRRNHYVDPVIDVVAMLPKDELASMAESLVSLTSFKKRVTMEEETVGGPIDVALISKGDGFIWIKRKHYFEPKLNPQFFANYYRRCENGKKE